MSSGASDTKSDSSGSASNRTFPIYWSQLPSIKIVRQPKDILRRLMRDALPIAHKACEDVPSSESLGAERFVSDASSPTKYPESLQHTTNIPTLADILVGETPDDQSASPDQDNVRHWDEGYYLWLSRSRWATQEKLDLMMRDLGNQAEWQRVKQQLMEEWEQQERQRKTKGASSMSDAAEGAQAQMQGHKQQAAQQPQVLLTRRPFPDLTDQSILLPIPPPFPPLQEQIRNLLAPSQRVLGLTHDSLQSGAQWRFMGLMWEKAMTDKPFVLARNVCSRMWDKWKKGPPEDSP
ncbi:uncharacterized protein FIBRA_06816 [Fibroporia radiculosa]|uniref:Uncharacterized protein n=1 Tax=Fibroporia radiculosa TaxID=599839 RepID=J4HZP7_9APHY|nr:uncharacterized protein FIBRA_06816 [Fibroporia radiculosa]CCM04632.1 predicted protein [Fibroporia radiculosa]